MAKENAAARAADEEAMRAEQAALKAEQDRYKAAAKEREEARPATAEPALSRPRARCLPARRLTLCCTRWAVHPPEHLPHMAGAQAEAQRLGGLLLLVRADVYLLTVII